MQSRSIFAGLLVAALCGLAFALHREYFFVEGPASWHDAQQHCREKHTDLAFFTSLREAQRAAGLNTGRAWGWIGLYRDAKNASLWHWSGGRNSTFRFWSGGEPNNVLGREDCGMVFGSGNWNDFHCNTKISFFCYEEPELVLVTENKTWEGALRYCRDQHRDLPSLLSKTDHHLAQNTTAEAMTSQVWTGLRFLAGQWLWVNGDELVHQAWSGDGVLPLCPALHLRCGTLAKEGERWGTWDCQERFNFLCLSFKNWSIV